MPDTDRLINKDQGDSIISAIQGITARLQEMYTVDDALSSTSENPVQNKVVKGALDGKVDTVSGKGLSTNDYTNEDKASVEESAKQLESTQSVSGNPLTLTDVAPINAESLVVELEPIQEGSGDPSPTNIRPITGYTECEVDDVGKNLFDKSDVINGGFNADGTVFENIIDSRRVSGYIDIEPNTAYYMSNVISLSGGRPGFWYDENQSAISQITFPSTIQTSGAVTSPSNAKYIRICVPSDTLDTAQIEKGSTATQYEPYHSSNAAIQFGQTVYGGRSNFTDGGTESKKYSYSLTGTETTIYKHATVPGVFGIYMENIITSLGGIVGDNQTLVYRGLNSMFTPASYVPADQLVDHTTDSYGGTFSNTGMVGLWFKFKESTFADLTVEQLKAKLAEYNSAGTPLQYVFDVVPTTIATPKTDLKLLQGTNNITTNGTTINLGYQPDNVIGEVKGEIEKCSPNPEFMHFEVDENVVDAIPIIFDETRHSYTVSGDNWKDKTFLCVECCDMRYGILQLVLSSDMAFVDSCGKALMLYPYMRSVEQYIKISISLGQSYGYEISYQTTNTSSLLDYLKIRVRLFN